MKSRYTLLACLMFFSANCLAQIQTACSYLDISKPTGGPISTGDIVEVRAIISVPGGTTVTGLTYSSTVPAGTTYQAGTLRAMTNEGVVMNATIPNTNNYTDAVGDDRGQIVGSAVTIYMGTGATSMAGGTIVGGSTTPVFYNSQSIIMVGYKVKVNVGITSISLTGALNYTTGGSPVSTTLNSIEVGTLSRAACSGFGSTNFMVAETNGTFGSGNTLNRSTSSGSVTGFTFTNLTAGQPADGNYSIVKNTSPTQYTGAAPAGSDRVFGVWDVIGDHTGTATGAGNPPSANGATGGYMLAVNGTYAPASVFKTTVSGLTTNTDYTLTFWIYNLCSACGASPSANASSGTPGVKPNLAFSLGGYDYYNSGEIAYTGQWVKNSFTFNSKALTSYTISIRNNAPGGGGNDWAIDDISLTTCLTILPLRLVSFDGSQEPGGVALTWQTASEKNTSYFDIQRSDENNNFISIGHVTASSLASGSTYHFTDITPFLQGQAYYRLGMADIDGKISYSQVVDVKEEGMLSKIMNIAPNPAKSHTTLYVVADAAGTVQVSLSTFAGSRVYSRNYSVSKGQNALPIESLDRLAKGLYVVYVVSDHQSASTKLLVE